MVDARSELADTRATCRMLHNDRTEHPANSRAHRAVPGRVGRLVPRRRHSHCRRARRDRPTTASHRPPPHSEPHDGGLIRASQLTINPDTFAARLRGRTLRLTRKEFGLLTILAQQPGRVFTRDQLRPEVRGYDYFAGTRTIHVHIRRLRAKLGFENEPMIGTLRHVGLSIPRNRGGLR